MRKPEEEILDRIEVLARIDGNRQVLAELADLFNDDCPRMLDAIRQAIGEGHGLKLQFAAHTVKGSLGVFSAKRAAEAAEALEDMGRENNLTRASEALAVLEQEIAKFQDALTSVCQETSVAR